MKGWWVGKKGVTATRRCEGRREAKGRKLGEREGREGK